MHVDVVRQLRHVDAAIRLTRDPNVLVFELRVLLEEVLQEDEVVRAGHVVGREAVGHTRRGVRVLIASREANTSGLVDPQDVSEVSPGVIVPKELLSLTSHDVGTILLEHGEHGGAARATVEPDDKRGVGGVVLRLGKVVVKRLVVVDVEVARVGGEVEDGHLGHLEHAVGLGGGNGGGGNEGRHSEGALVDHI